jgi:HEAT repeat protein
MSVLSKLASALNRKDEVPNQELAKQLASKADRKAIQELIENLTNKSSAIQSDCIKVLYEIGERKPQLIAEYVKEFIALLDNKNNRLQWGAMTALSSIALEAPKIVNAGISKILSVSNNGSVIAKDHAVNILIKLSSIKPYNETAFPLLIKELLKSPTNQLPMYAEKAMPVINEKNKRLFIKTLSSRLDDIEKDTKRKRVEKVIQKFSE